MNCCFINYRLIFEKFKSDIKNCYSICRFFKVVEYDPKFYLARAITFLSVYFY